MLTAATAARAALLAIAAIPLVAGCASEERTACDDPGTTYAQVIYFESADGSWDETTVFLVCTPDRTVGIVDENAQDYTSLEDFQINNELFEEGDQMIVTEDFPAIDAEAEFKTVPARIDDPAVMWWTIGGAAAAVIAAGLLVWLWLRKRRKAIREGEEQAEALRAERDRSEAHGADEEDAPGRSAGRGAASEPSADRDADPTAESDAVERGARAPRDDA
ncbi:hypothetical protein LO763_15395 [Glycomyces sp. A-F 0318]|uniref:hypothetical protein n=1 Tax=Glycomyces amatae TaxID=2881355 RepID=UPI001E2FB8D9|nr:hypothetical protein [Glycomyces amatae]MCD0445001.1 hypothetical protein [Glycomyces amatae]